MTQSLYLRLALPTPLNRLFDYLPPEHIDFKSLIPGIRVEVPFQSRTLIGILISVEAKTTIPVHKLKRATRLLDVSPILTAELFKLAEWAAQYYHTALGEVLSAAMPQWLRKGRTAEMPPLTAAPTKTVQPALDLNAAQAAAVSAITQSKHQFRTFLLDGVTGSGKTEVYLQAIANLLVDEVQVLVLVPEISLTPQTIARFRARFSVPMAVLHSSLSEKKRLQAWLSARDGTAKIIIGTRSAIFTPMKKLGLIIVDEEHDSSFKQQDRFRYHARDLAIVRASELQIPIVLGSATPSLESVNNAKLNRYTHLPLPDRAGGAAMPNYELIDLRQEKAEEGLSPSLLQAIKSHLASNNQVMIFLNRRGFAPVLYCTQCAWIAECSRCDARMVYHRSPARLQCHHCDTKSNIPIRCANCHEQTLQPVGLGTQRVEETLAALFKEVPIIRVDRDSTRKKNAMEKLLAEINEQPKAILIGTQMLAKGHHFPNVTLVCILDADSGLFSADFRAIEQMGQLLIQVAGRAGREEKKGTVLIQTKYPAHPLLQTLIHEGYQSFANTLLIERQQAALPPFSYVAIFRAESYTEQKAIDFLAAIKKISASFSDAITLFGPVPAMLAKRKGLHCQQLLVRSDKRKRLQQFLVSLLKQLESSQSKSPVKWVLDVDPVEMG